MGYKCSICGQPAQFMPASGACPICKNVCTYIPIYDPPKIYPPPEKVAKKPPRVEHPPPVKSPPQKIETRREKEKVSSKPKPPKPPKTSQAEWSWGMAIISFFIGTGVGMNQFGLEREAALIFGGIIGIIFGRYYKPIIVLAIIAFIVYALLQNQ